jgi:hypothetical protein
MKRYRGTRPGQRNGRGCCANMRAVTVGRQDGGASKQVPRDPTRATDSRGAREELGADMGPAVAKSEKGLALSRGPDLEKANRANARAEGSAWEG